MKQRHLFPCWPRPRKQEPHLCTLCACFLITLTFCCVVLRYFATLFKEVSFPGGIPFHCFFRLVGLLIRLESKLRPLGPRQQGHSTESLLAGFSHVRACLLPRAKRQERGSESMLFHCAFLLLVSAHREGHTTTLCLVYQSPTKG